MGHKTVAKILLKAGTVHCSDDKYNPSSLTRAVENKHEAVELVGHAGEDVHGLAFCGVISLTVQSVWIVQRCGSLSH